MRAAELRRLLKKHGCKFENHNGGSGHQTVRRGQFKSTFPGHSGSAELGNALGRKILTDLRIR